MSDRVAVKASDFPEETARARLDGGNPILTFDDWYPGWDNVKPVLRQWEAWVNGVSDGTPGEPLEDVPPVDETLFKSVARAWYAGTPPLLDAPLLVTSLAGACLKPFLHAHSRMLMPMVKQEQWRRRFCPVCGGAPDFAFLAREDGARWLLCSRCDARWLFQRLECPHCGNQQQNGLFYLTDVAQRYRLYLCDACKGYMKAVDMRVGADDADLAVERISTVDLDWQAMEMGYLPRDRVAFIRKQPSPSS